MTTIYYECLNCKRSGPRSISRIVYVNTTNGYRLLCNYCHSFNLCKINNNGKKILINGDLSPSDKPFDISAMTEEERNIEEFLLRLMEIEHYIDEARKKNQGVIKRMKRKKLIDPKQEQITIETLENTKFALIGLIKTIYDIRGKFEV